MLSLSAILIHKFYIHVIYFVFCSFQILINIYNVYLYGNYISFI